MVDFPSRLEALAAALESGLVERRQPVRLALLAALAGEHTLLIGPPGTAKSLLARRIHGAFRGARYFERLLTRFTVPEELFGPLSIRALEEDRYERHTAGFLPDATIAFIDEVFKANSAILNALLTLLNEREFDNGAGRQACPLISVIGATNAVPDDEVGEAFFDRFLVRLTVAPVSPEGFARLMEIKVGAVGTAAGQAFDSGERQALIEAAAATTLPEPIVVLLGELRAFCASNAHPVSDRRWVKLVALLRMAAASAGHTSVSRWDLLLAPCCLAHDAAGQHGLTEWLTGRLGVRAAFAPPRLVRIAEAFEAQLDIEQQANDLDYDESGRLKFSSAEAIAEQIGDAKGGSAALRMTYHRARRYGSHHIAARTRQIDNALLRLDDYRSELAALRADLTAYRTHNLWLDAAVLDRAASSLAGTAAALDDIAARLALARDGFLALPRLAQDDAGTPDEIQLDWA
jgi:MoxR-like ATPase